jgi:hypothetical protein
MATTPPLAPYVSAALTANGASTGLVTIGDTSNFRKGCTVWLGSGAVTPVMLIIDSVVSSTVLALRDPTKIGTARYAGCSAYLTADSATITQNEQTDFLKSGSW